MRLSAPACLLLFLHVASSQENCSQLDVLNHLQLIENPKQFSLVRPVKNYSTPTNVFLDVIFYAILDVRESDQTFIAHIWTTMWWKNEFIEWNPDEFCGNTGLIVPVKTLWIPDLTILEMTENDKSNPSPYLVVTSNGTVYYTNDQVVKSTCKMDVYKFPFDTQKCNVSFRSVLHFGTQIKLNPLDSDETTLWSIEEMKAQYEWIFCKVTVSKSTNSKDKKDMITYSVLVERRSMLYVVNFLLPVLFFLFLDFASFLMTDTGGEKLGFKITVLLAVTVLQLLLNEILPVSSDRIPLIAIYCIGIFTLMLLSLLEAIIVLYLIHRDQKPDQDHSNFYRGPLQGLKDAISLTRGALPLDFTTEKDQVLDPTLSVLLTHLQQNHKEDEAQGYWAKRATNIHRVFFTFYFSASLAFLSTLFYLWTEEPEELCTNKNIA